MVCLRINDNVLPISQAPDQLYHRRQDHFSSTYYSPINQSPIPTSSTNLLYFCPRLLNMNKTENPSKDTLDQTYILLQ